jgi:resuscitation-promoting factor RpfA
LQETSGNAVEAAPGATATMAAVPPAPAPSVDGITEPTASDTPAQELDKIQQLFKQGQTNEARQRLAAFQHAHPQWDLPPELRAQLRKP